MATSDYDCTYCGMRATCLDHVVPRSYNSATERDASDRTKRDCVPACTECNLLLSNFMYITVSDRALYLTGRLEDKHKKVLSSPNWTEEEYEDLSGSLLKHVKSLQTKKKLIRARIEYARSVSEMKELTVEGVWNSQQSNAKGSNSEV